jgi:hypothetical protein
MGTNATALGLKPTFLDELRRFLDNFIESGRTTYLGGVYLVHGDDELAHTEGERQEGVLTGLTILGNTGFEFTTG